MPTVVQLQYDVDPATQKGSDLVAKVAAVSVDAGVLTLLGFSIFADNTSLVGNTVRRIIQLSIDAGAQINFPTAAQRLYATKNLYGGAIALGVPCLVVATDPVEVVV